MRKHLLSSLMAGVIGSGAMAVEAAPYQPRDHKPRIDIYRDSYNYVGFDVASWTLDIDATADKAGVSADGVGGRILVGRRFSDFLSAEAHAMTGGEDDNARLERNLGVFVKAALPMGRLQMKGLVGFSALQFTLPDYDNSYSGLSWGVGAEVTVWRDIYLNADYIRFYSSSDTDIDSVNFGLGMRW